ncbi:MAG TPA: NAD(P)/FAD-dependent oxidoreductase [Tissierellales bacterium]|nr:NAD(P)/FAD-dependent oxidoreductase [Tissierellales bacterium]
MKNYDVLIIGGGLAGYYCALYCKRRDLNVAIVEKSILGGTGIRTGALPVKKLLDSFKNNDIDNKIIKESLIRNWDENLQYLDDKLKDNLKNNGIDIYFGDGEFLDEHRYIVEESILYGENIVIATGTEPSSVEEIKIDNENIITHKDAIDIRNLPESIIILGGNVEGVEFASIYERLGVKVSLVEKEESLLFENDEELVKPIEDNLKKRKVEIIKGNGAQKTYIKGSKVKVVLEDGQVLEGDKVLVTLSRKPSYPKGIDKLNIDKDDFKIKVYENLRTNVKHIYAIGDINGILGLASGAIQQGIAVSDNILYNKPVTMNYNSLPRAVYTLPEMAGAGYQEKDLVQEGIDYIKGYSYFSNTWRGWAKNIEEGFLKVLIDKEGIILGIWMVGENVSEYIGLLGVLLEKNISVEDVKSNLVIHPSLWEALLDAILNAER